jgi:hypothetical protein
MELQTDICSPHLEYFHGLSFFLLAGEDTSQLKGKTLKKMLFKKFDTI